MDCKFFKGQKVVCKDEGGEWIKADVLPPCNQPVAFPEPGQIYTIRDFMVSPRERWVGLLLVELNNKCSSCGDEPSFDHYGFRPLDERKTDISVFEEIARWQSDGANVDPARKVARPKRTKEPV